jgi:pimeloyl-ACP methyl ester carboxylesterase
MSRIPLLWMLVVLVVTTPRAIADTVVLVVKSATIAATKANGAPWDFPLVGRKSLPDPYVKLWVYDKDGAHVDYGETTVAWDTLSPVWNKDIAKVKAGQRIKVELWDKDLKYDDLIGRQTFTLTERLIEKGSFIHRFDRVKYLRFDVRADGKPRNEARITLQQPFPGPYSANQLTRTKGRARAVVLLHGLDLRDDGGSPSRPRFVDWQGSTSPLVKTLSSHADVFAISYAQNTAVEEIASFPELREAVGKVKQLGYDQVILLGHSAGGLVARHFVEEHPRAGVTGVIQVATPNAGAKLAGWAVKLLQVPKEQAPFVQSLCPAHRAAVLKSRQDRVIPATIDFVTVVTSVSAKANGDSLLNWQCQWSVDLQNQGIPCVCVQGTHLEVMAHDACLDVYCRLITQPQPRWSASKVQQAALAAN